MGKENLLQHQEKTPVQMHQDEPQYEAALNIDQVMQPQQLDAPAQLLTQHTQANLSLTQRLQSSVPTASAVFSAPGSPIQTMPPASKSWKKTQKDKWHAKQAQKHTIFGDHVSYTVNKHLTQSTLEKDNSMRSIAHQSEGADTGSALLRPFLSGYRTNKKGQPLNDSEKDKMVADQKFAADYLSGDLSARSPHLERITGEILNMPLSLDMFRDDLLEVNSVRLKDFSERLSQFKALMDDPVNKPFFEDLPAEQKVRLNHRLQTISPAFTNLLRTNLAMKGLTEQGGYSNRPVDYTWNAQHKQERENAFRTALQEEQALLAAQQESAAPLLEDRAEPLTLQQQTSDEAHLEEKAEVLSPEQRVEERLKTLKFTHTSKPLPGLSPIEAFFKSHSAGITVNGQKTQRDGLRDAFAKRFASNPGYSGGITGVIGNASGSVLIQGLSAQRTASLFEFALGGNKTTDEIAATYDKLLCGSQYRDLKAKQASNSITPEEEERLKSYTQEDLAQMDATFDKGMLELKQLQYEQLLRLRDKYGRWATQLHPHDFIARTGPEFFDDTSLLQDVTEMLADGKKYFDFDSSEEDRQYRDLSYYFHGIRAMLAPYVSAPQSYSDQQLIESEMRRATKLDTFQGSLKLEKVIGGAGFTEEEQQAYNQKLHQRIQGGEALPQLDHLRTQEELEKAQKEQEIAEQKRQDEHASEFWDQARLSREDATNTHSDILSQKGKSYFKGLALRFAKGSPLKQALQDYANVTRYDVGYTEEHRLLNVLIKVAKETNPSAEMRISEKDLNDVKQALEQLTNGTLTIPKEAVVQDYTKEPPKEVGTISRGSFRNAIIRGFSYWSDQRNTPLFSHEPTTNDLKQRMVSNCYMVAGTAGLVNVDPAMLKSCLRDNGDGTVTVRLYQSVVTEEELQKQKDAEKIIAARIAERERRREGKELAGAYTMEDEMQDMADEGEDCTFAYTAKKTLEPIYVKVTKEIPRIAGADTLSAGALWMQMIEKACAYVGRDGISGYQSLWYGEGGQFLERLLGIPAETVYLKSGQMDEEEKAKLFEQLCATYNHLKENDTKTKKGSADEGPKRVYNTGTGAVDSKDGLNAGHAYTILGGKMVGDKRFVLLRNPYSTMSLHYEDNGKTKTRTGSHLAPSSDETYGQFYMEFDEFLTKFEKITCTDLSKAPQ